MGPFVGAVLGELASGKSVLRSTHVGFGAWIGLIFGTIVKLVASLIMVALFGADGRGVAHRIANALSLRRIHAQHAARAPSPRK